MTHEIIPYFGLRDPVATGTHGIAFLLAVIGAFLLWHRARGNLRTQIIVSVFGLAMVSQYAAGATYHALQVPWEQLRFFLLWDLCAIYVLIAGTYTPIALLLIPKGWRRIAIFVTIWFMAAMGIAFKVFSFTGVLSHEPYWIRALLYLGMGWFALAMALDMVRAVGFRGLRWAIYGGLSYTLGVAVEIQGEPCLWPGVIGPHELFHVLVMAGTYCHFIFIWSYVLPYANAATGCDGELSAQVEIVP